MPKEYIVWLIMDWIHESVVILRKQPNGKQKLIGGVVYRAFYEQRFAEIAFLAITHTEQIKGYGTWLMNVLKAFCKKDSIDYFLTYADNHAVEYFKK